MKITELPVSFLGKIFRYCNRNTITSLFDTDPYFRQIILQYYDNIEDFHLHENQWTCAKQILGHFFQDTRYVLLTAQPQSGKTGVCQAVCFLLKQYAKQFNITNFWFICGMNDNNLKRQQIHEFSGLVPEQNVLFSKDLAGFGKKRFRAQNNKLKLNNQEDNSLKEIAKLPNAYFRNSLIILDESHYAQQGQGVQASMVHRFLSYEVGLTLDGFDHNWKGQNLWFLSVSATPMSELCHFLQPGQSKARVLLRPGRDYYGFQDMFYLKKIHKAYNLADVSEQKKLINIMKKHYRSQQSQNQYKYAIIRFSNTTQAQAHREVFKGLIDFPVKYIKFHSKEMSLRDINKIVREPPNKFTIIEVYHSLRAGIQLDTSNICLVHETHRANTDVTAQGLAGRCCGYFKEKHNVDIYCHRDYLEKYSKLITNDFNPKYVPSNCTNIKQGHCDDACDKFIPNVPMGGKMDNELIEDLLKYKAKNPRRYPGFMDEFIDRIGNLEFIMERIWCNYHFVGVTILDETNKTESKTNTWIKFWNPAFNAWKNRKNGAYFRNNNLDDNYDDFTYVYINLKKDHEHFGFILVTSQRRMSDQPRDYIRTTGKEEFHPMNNPLDDIEFDIILKSTFLQKQKKRRNEEFRSRINRNEDPNEHQIINMDIKSRKKDKLKKKIELKRKKTSLSLNNIKLKKKIELKNENTPKIKLTTPLRFYIK